MITRIFNLAMNVLDMKIQGAGSRKIRTAFATFDSFSVLFMCVVGISFLRPETLATLFAKIYKVFIFPLNIELHFSIQKIR